MLFLVSDRTNGQFWQCSTSKQKPCSRGQLLDLCDDSSIEYGQIGCVDFVYGNHKDRGSIGEALLSI